MRGLEFWFVGARDVFGYKLRAVYGVVRQTKGGNSGSVAMVQIRVAKLKTHIRKTDTAAGFPLFATMVRRWVAACDYANATASYSFVAMPSTPATGYVTLPSLSLPPTHCDYNFLCMPHQNDSTKLAD